MTSAIDPEATFGVLQDGSGDGEAGRSDDGTCVLDTDVFAAMKEKVGWQLYSFNFRKSI